MYNDFRIITVTPAGRRRYMEILLPYLLNNRELIDEHHWWVNTGDEEDLSWIAKVCAEYPDFLRQIPCPGKVDGNRSVSLFYGYCTDDNVIYIKIDDDIVWMADDAIRELVRFRIENPAYFLIYANIVNNVLIDRLRQRNGLIDFAPFLIDEKGHNGWQDPRSAEAVHWSFLRHHANGEQNRHKCIFERYIWAERELCSINFVCWHGEDMKKLAVEGDDEEYLSRVAPGILGLLNVVCGSSLVAHFAFQPQREYLDRSPILEQYAGIAAGKPADCRPRNVRLPNAHDMTVCFFTFDRSPDPGYIGHSLGSFAAASRLSGGRMASPHVIIDGHDESWLQSSYPCIAHPVEASLWNEVGGWEIHRRIAYSYERCFRIALEEDRSGVLICEDDVEFRPDLFERLNGIFAEMSRDGRQAFVLSLYFPGAAADTDDAYSVYPGWQFFGGQAVFFSRAIIEEARENWARRGWRDGEAAERPNDLMIGDFGHSLWRRYGEAGGLYRCRLDLVQHKGDVSNTGLSPGFHSSLSFGVSYEKSDD